MFIWRPIHISVGMDVMQNTMTQATETAMRRRNMEGYSKNLKYELDFEIGICHEKQPREEEAWTLFQ